jgi:5-(carboxyamino)imidazole ribonucleotide synthase
MNKPLRIGILGGGQLGRMLLQTAANYHVETFVLETGNNPPASSLCHYFIEGDIKDYNTVYNFGKQVDVLPFLNWSRKGLLSIHVHRL